MRLAIAPKHEKGVPSRPVCRGHGRFDRGLFVREP